MKPLTMVLAAIFLIISSTLAQERTEERKWTIDPETGDSVYTEAVIVSESEDITPRSNMIVINPLKFLLFYNISYFHKISENSAFGIGLQTPTLSGLDGFGINAEARFYPKGKNLKGFYFAPNVSYNSLSGENSSNSLSVTSIGGLLGWQWFPGEDFAMGLGIGIDYYFFNGEDDAFTKVDGMSPLIRFDIGYAW